ncbi:MAG: tail fiber protein [Bacteroidales bacterium]|nr:tail fiber protein [Bacteroidales bacterium]
MNIANYLNDGNVDRQKYPLSVESLDFIQQQIRLVHELANIAGANFIIQGCNVNGTQTSAGTLIINGEVLPLVAGLTQTKIRIRESVENITAQYVNYANARVKRWVEFGENPGDVDTYLWADFVRIKTNAQLELEKATHAEVEALQNLIMPSGAIIMWKGSIQTIPDGWALCDGENGTPNLLNKFIVAAGQQYSVGQTGGLESVTLGISQIPSHRHKIAKVSRDDGSTDGGDVIRQGDDLIGTTYDSYTDYQGGGQAHENRPPYYALAYIMKL